MHNEIDFEQRFWNRTKKLNESDCWPWLGQITPQGYGSIQIDGKSYRAHRLSYNINKGIIKDGFVIDHLCQNKSCVNPHHLEAVSPKQNTIRYQNIRKLNK